MTSVCSELDKNLARLAWSLWTELGVAGLERKHQSFAVAPEELIILTSMLADFDPRLRDEALDWCTRYHHLLSPLRLGILAKKYRELISEPFSIFAATFNSMADIRTKWPTLKKASPLKLRLSGKSVMRDLKAPSMIYFRLRSFLGVGVRADVIAFLICENPKEFAASDLLEMGYSKRRLAQVLSELAAAGILSQSHIRNQLRYTLLKRNFLMKLLGDIPKKFLKWDRILAVLLPIYSCLHRVENTAVGVRAIDIRNLLTKLSKEFMQIKLTPPSYQNNLEAYWQSVTKWILTFSAALAQGEVNTNPRK
jgi:hypothetical protein